MQQPSFDIHAKILHSGQYEVKKSSIEVPIKHFNEGVELEKNVQERIRALNDEILDLEQQLRDKRRLNQEQADRIIEQAQDEAKKVLEDAEQHAFDRVQKSVQEKESLIQQASEEGERIKIQANRDADDIKYNAERDAVKIKEQAKDDGFQEGHNAGLDAGRNEVSFAVERLHGIIAETVRERERILNHSEQQVINLVLTMVTKVVKKLTADHQQVVIENTKAALELLRGAITLFVRVSPYDYNFTQSFKEEFIRMIEAKAELKFIEDPTIEPGGVYIETEMGDVDATIRSQLEELETQMRFYMPVKVHSPETKKVEPKAEESPDGQDIPKTPFAQREEYQSTVTTNTDNLEKLDTQNSVNDIVVENVNDKDESSSETENMQTINNEDSQESANIDNIQEPLTNPEIQALHSYQEEATSQEESSEENDDIIV